jgi:hypothetical protein
MSELERPEPESASDAEDPRSNGLNLKLIYSLIALAMVLAIGFAALIVLPFYHRR